MTIVFWLPFAFAALHIFEEFAWPGEATWSMAAVSAVLGSSYQFWSILNHRRRSAAVTGGA